MDQNLPVNQFEDMISQRDELRNEGEQIQQQQNGIGGEPTSILQENCSQPNVNNNNNNRGQRMKWTKQLNIDIIRCYFNTILRIPNQPYRRDFHTRWTTLHPENPLTEQRICDQHRVIMKKANTQENIRCMDHETWNTSTEKRCIKGNWKWKESQQNELNNADVAIQGEHADLPHNIILPEENAIEQPNEINENELLKIKKTLVNAYAEIIVTPFDKRFNLRKPARKTIKKLEESLEKVNDVIEVTPLLTEKIDVTSLNQFTYAAAITAIKTARVENECIIKKRNINRTKGDWTFNMNRRITEFYLKAIRTRWKQNTKFSTRKQDPPHSKHSNSVCMPLTIDSPDITGDKNSTSKATTL